MSGVAVFFIVLTVLIVVVGGGLAVLYFTGIKLGTFSFKEFLDSKMGVKSEGGDSSQPLSDSRA